MGSIGVHNPILDWDAKSQWGNICESGCAYSIWEHVRDLVDDASNV